MAATKTGPAAPFTQEQIDDALTALVAFAGNANAAVKFLEAEGKRYPCNDTLQNWSRTLHWERYEQLREKFSQKREQSVTNTFRDAAQRAADAMLLAVEKAEEKLQAGKDDDPARSAANLARVAQSSTDKLLSMTGRPTQITESRGWQEIVRSLVASGVATIDGQSEDISAEQIEAGADE